MENKFKHQQFPFYSVSDFYKEKYGEKIYKISVDGGFTCPNRDGSIHHSGCIFCSNQGSGDFAVSNQASIKEQLQEAKARIKQKSDAKKFIVYFQAFTNTYGPPEHLKRLYQQAVSDDSVVGISIATRPDCLSVEIIKILTELNKQVDVYVELGLQTINSSSAEFIRRGYPLSVYDSAVTQLKKAGLNVITHVIIGLPFETEEDILRTIEYVGHTKTSGIKLQLLHVLTDTDLYSYYLKHPFHLFSLDEYTDLIVNAIQLLPPDMVIHRLTGDGPKHLLFEPKWSLDKKRVLGTIYSKLKTQNAYQSQYYKENIHG